MSISHGSAAPVGSHEIDSASTSIPRPAGVDRSRIRVSGSTTQYSGTRSSRNNARLVTRSERAVEGDSISATRIGCASDQFLARRPFTNGTTNTSG